MFGSSLIRSRKNDVRFVFTSSFCMRGHVLFTLFVFDCVLWCPAYIVLCFCFVFRRLVYPMLQVSLDCPFLITPSVFSNVYSKKDRQYNCQDRFKKSWLFVVLFFVFSFWYVQSFHFYVTGSNLMKKNAK